ncbi:MAG: class I tRNA ligase family protein, partial [Fischerella sp.]|nr:class I tRNA ligase family protein [Fischerella sp.]
MCIRDRDNYGLGEAAKGLYDFIWGDFCDWYIELVKSRLQKGADPVSRRVAQQTLAYVLEGILKLLAPFMPHITEEIWHTLTQQPTDSQQSLSLQLYPEAQTSLIDTALEEQFELLIDTIRTIRNLRAEADVKPGMKVSVNLQTDSEKERQILTAGQSYIQDLAKVENLTIAAGRQNQQNIGAEKPRIGWKRVVAIIAAIYLLRIGLAIADALDDIPLLGTFLEIVGFGYTTWFVTRNLLSAQARQKFWKQLFQPTTHKDLPPAKVLPQPPEPEKAIAGVVGTVQVLLPLTGVVDVDAYTAKLQKRLSKIEAEIKSLSARLNNPKFVEQAPANVVQEARDTFAEAQKQAEILRNRLRQLA